MESSTPSALHLRAREVRSVANSGSQVSDLASAASMSMLASAGDGTRSITPVRAELTGLDGNIIFWIPSLTPTVTFGDNAEDAKYEREHWRAKSQVR